MAFDPPVAVGNIIEIRPQSFGNSQIGMNVLHFTITGAVAGATISIFSTLYASTVETLYKLCLCQVQSYLGHSARKVYPLPTSLPWLNATNASLGTGGVALLPQAVSGLISFQTSFAGRSNRGRAYIPFPSETDNNASTAKPESAYVSKLAALAAALTSTMSDHAGNNMQMCVYQRKLPAVSPLIIGWRANQLWATQHRRGDFGRINSGILS